MTRLEKITELLLENSQETEYSWTWLKKGKTPTKKEANKFMLGCILDYQIRAETAWANAERLAKEILGDPSDLWGEITKVTQSAWNKKRKAYSLHRFPIAHERVWRIGNDIVKNYNSDARNIWKGKPPHIVLDRLEELRVGEQISRMVVGALIYEKQIKGIGDIPVNLHVRRVLGRVVRGEGYTLAEKNIVIEKTTEMYKKNPWKLDKALYELGKGRRKAICKASDPSCAVCYLKIKCQYYKINKN